MLNINIGLLIIATNRYYEYAIDLIHSADKHFLTKHNVVYFLFSNRHDVIVSNTRQIVKTNIDHKSWPWMTLGRYHIFIENQELFQDMDYLFYCDADMLFVNDVGDEILSPLVATQHPGYYGTRGTPEINMASSAYIPPSQPMQYFAGGFNGGYKEEYLKMSHTLANQIDIDFANGIIATWHDESHMNKYFAYNHPTKILTPSYCYGESMNLPYNKKIIARNKNHQYMRT